MMYKIWYTQRYIDHQLHGDNIYRTRIRERPQDVVESASDRVVAKDLVRIDATRICEAVNPIAIND